ncbi:MAG: aminotransferase class I/II-fold pyridoxal phosphate-dependent enzyme [Pirellulales bacterium]|nr:aminotransferase class I/II-fold pyridoxal phosphate-dependent enzyme [Pirellulales bacterium]
MATSDISSSRQFTFRTGPVSANHAEEFPQVAEDADVVIDSETALVDFIRRREQGIDFRVAATAFHAGVAVYEEKGHHLYRRQLLGPSDANSRVHYPRESFDREMIILASNNYLGLTTHPRVIEAARDAATRYGTGSGSSPLLVGTFPVTGQLENKLAAFKGVEEVCLFSTGYAANVGVISCVASKHDLIVVDRLAHASIVDGAKLSGAKLRTFKHNDADHLDRVLRRTNDVNLKLVCVEGIYSMDGDIGPIDKIMEVCRRHNAMLLVDEAHSTGVLGPQGRGAVAHFGLDHEPDLLIVGTLSKALGACGGFVGGKAEYVNHLRYFARSGMFSTAQSPMVTAAANAAVDVIMAEPQLRERLWENVRFLHGELKRLGFVIGECASPIIPVILGSMTALRQMTLELHSHNVCVNSVPFPAVPHGSERLRVSLTANHTIEQLEQALEIIQTAARHAGVL